MVRIFGSPGRSRRLRVGVAIAACTALVIGVMAGPVLAVHDLDFELDGNIATESGGPAFDWDSFFNASGSPSPVLPDASRPGFTTSGFDKDFNTNTNGSFNTSDSSTFATGSKDTLPITPGWQCNQDNNVLSKSDVMNAYATSFTDDKGTATLADDEDLMYFALERNANTGTGNVGFWFLGDGTVDCSSSGSTTAFTGNHQDGDLLIVSEFSQGGAVSTIFAYEWVGDSPGALDPDPVAQGASCGSGTGDDDICARVNTGTISGIPWTTANKQDGVGNSLRVSEFFEGGINLTLAGLGDECFNTFIGDTRSSTSLTATIFDFSRGSLGGCDSDLVTTPSAGKGGSVSIGTGTVSVTDSADLTVTGNIDTWSGTLSFFICGPIAAPATCSTGGVPSGSSTVTQATTMPVVSTAATLTSAGRYCWRGFFDSATDGVPDATDSSTDECFTVTPVTPPLDTAAVASPVDFGQPVQDNATLSGTATQPGSNGPNATYPTINPTTPGAPAGGKITFTLLKANCTDLATGTPAGGNPQDVTVSGDGTYGPVSFTPDAPGTYHWKAQYFPAAGDPNNVGSTHNGSCNDTDETVVVNQVPTSITTRQFVFPQDKATITTTPGGLTLSGNVSFRLFDTSANCLADDGTASATGLLYSEAGTLHPISGTSPQSATTNNTTVRITTNTTVYWRVTYTSNTQAQLGSSSVCLESTAVTYAGNDGTISIP